ncbi:MAG: ABC transporter ATP-binding protein [Opitutales bacterium]
MAAASTPAVNAPPLQVEDLRKVYRARGRPELVAVDDVSLEIAAGECLGLLGPNGSGKSTTIACCTGFFPVTSGTIRLFGLDVAAEPKAARHRMGVCAQEQNLDTDFSALDQLVRHATYFGMPEREGRQRAEVLLERFELTEKRDELVEHLSGGMQRRLQVARALISSPDLLILDEPTTGLDPDARRALWRILIEERERGLGVLLSTHYMDEAERLCDRIALIYRGKILDVAPPRELIERHIGTEEVTEEVRPGLTWKRPPNLEDVFLKLSGSSLEA